MRRAAAPPAEPVSKPADIPDYRGTRAVIRRERAWNGVSALHIDIRADGMFEAEMPVLSPSLLFTVEALGGRVLLMSERQRALFRQTGPLSVAPAGTDVLVRGRARHFRQLVLRFDQAPADDGIDLATAFRPRFMFADPCLAGLCLLLADECVSPSPMGGLFGDSLIVSLLLALSRDEADGCRTTGGLAPWQMRRLDCFVEAHLGEDLSLDSLAQQAGVSRSHLGRAFKHTVGQSPFEWVRAKRIERAKQLLAEGRVPLAEIAIATGFADQAHLTRAFGRLVGLPPGAWQRVQAQVVGENLFSTEVQNEESQTSENPRFVA